MRTCKRIMKLSDAIAQRVKNLLNERKIKQYTLHKMGGIPKSTISNVVNNNREKVAVDTIYQICATLNISLEEFFADPLFNNLDD